MYRRGIFFGSIISYLLSLTSYLVFPKTTELFWIASLILGIAFFVSKFRLSPIDTKEWLVVSCVVLIAFMLRVVFLTELPGFVHGDEAETGIAARQIMIGKNGSPLIGVIGFFDMPVMSAVVYVPFLLVFGDSLLALRLFSVVSGVISIWLTYILGTALFKSRYAGILASMFLTVFALHIHYSRSGISYMQGLVAVVAAVYCYVRGTQKDTQHYWLFMAGIIAGFSFLLYYSARIGIVIVGVCLIIDMVFTKKAQIQSYLIGCVLFLLGVMIGFGPQLVFYLKHPDTFYSRTNQVFAMVESPTYFRNITHMKNVYGTESMVEILKGQTLNAIRFFWDKGDTHLQYGALFSGVDKITTIVAAVGLIFALLQFRTRAFRVLLVWIVLMIGVTIFTIDAPAAQRILPVLPAIAAIAGYTLFVIVKRLQMKLGKGSYIMPVVVLAVVGIINGYRYFILYPKQRPMDKQTASAYYMKSLTNQDYVCIASSEIMFNNPTQRFLAPNVSGEQISNQQSIPKECTKVIVDGNTTTKDEADVFRRYFTVYDVP